MVGEKAVRSGVNARAYSVSMGKARGHLAALGGPGRWRLALMLLAVGGGAFYIASRVMNEAESRYWEWSSHYPMPEFHCKIEGETLLGYVLTYHSPSDYWVSLLYEPDIHSSFVGHAHPFGFWWLWGDIVANESYLVSKATRWDNMSTGYVVPASIREQLSDAITKYFDERFRSAEVARGRYRPAVLSAVLPPDPLIVGSEVVTREPGLDYRLGAWVMPSVSGLSALGFGASGLGVVTGVAWSVGASRRRAWRRREGTCGRCGYDARGLAICPECGDATNSK